MTLRELLNSVPNYPALASEQGMEFVVHDFDRETEIMTYSVMLGYHEGEIFDTELTRAPGDYVLVDYFDTDKRCECGSASVGSPAHSHWCPSFIQP